MGCWFILSYGDLLLHSWGPVWELFLPQWVFSIKCNNYKQRWYSNQRSITQSKLKQHLYPFYFRVFFQPAVSMYSSSSYPPHASDASWGHWFQFFLGLEYHIITRLNLDSDSSMTRSSIWPIYAHMAVLFACVWSRNLIKSTATSNNQFKGVSTQYLLMD